jgi:hypothetical protein
MFAKWVAGASAGTPLASTMVRVAVAAALTASVVSANDAVAATLSLSAGGTNSTLPASFNPSGIVAINADGIGVGTGITYFSGTGNTGGLFVSPQNVFLTFDYMGKEAGFTNQFILTLGNTVLFNTAVNSPGATTGATLFDVGADPGAVPFKFRAVTPGNKDAINGGAIASGLRLAFAKVSDSVWYTFFDDGGAGPDKDFDDMVIRITATDIPSVPVPAALPLFASGMGALWLVARRKKKTTAAAA